MRLACVAGACRHAISPTHKLHWDRLVDTGWLSYVTESTVYFGRYILVRPFERQNDWKTAVLNAHCMQLVVSNHETSKLERSGTSDTLFQICWHGVSLEIMECGVLMCRKGVFYLKLGPRLCLPCEPNYLPRISINLDRHFLWNHSLKIQAIACRAPDTFKKHDNYVLFSYEYGYC